MATSGCKDVTPAQIAQIGRRTRDVAPGAAIGKRSKYRAIPTTVDGIRFDSAKEAKRYQELKQLEKAGEIRGLVLQPKFELRASLMLKDISRERDPALLGRYVADFLYEERLVPKGGPVSMRREWRQIVEDVKGFKTPLYRWKKKHVEAQYGIQIREV